MTLWYIMVGCCVWCTCQNLRTRRARIWLHMSDSCQWGMKSNRSISVVEVRTVCMAPLIQRQCQCVFGPCIISWKLGWCPDWSLYSVGVDLFVIGGGRRLVLGGRDYTICVPFLVESFLIIPLSSLLVALVFFSAQFFHVLPSVGSLTAVCRWDGLQCGMVWAN